MFGEKSQTFEVTSGRVIVLFKELCFIITVRNNMLGCSNISTAPLHGPTAFMEHPQKPQLYLGGRIQVEPFITKIHRLPALMWLQEKLCPFSPSSTGCFVFFDWITPAKEYKTFSDHVRSMSVNL